MRPFVKSYGENSTVIRSSGSMRMRNILIFPERCASITCPFSSSTLNVVFGKSSFTTPCISMKPFLFVRGPLGGSTVGRWLCDDVDLFRIQKSLKTEPPSTGWIRITYTAIDSHVFEAFQDKSMRSFGSIPKVFLVSSLLFRWNCCCRPVFHNCLYSANTSGI